MSDWDNLVEPARGALEALISKGDVAADRIEELEAKLAQQDALVEQPIYDNEGEQTGTEMVDNPLIVQDDENRANAQAVIDATPQAVKDF